MQRTPHVPTKPHGQARAGLGRGGGRGRRPRALPRPGAEIRGRRTPGSHRQSKARLAHVCGWLAQGPAPPRRARRRPSPPHPPHTAPPPAALVDSRTGKEAGAGHTPTQTRTREASPWRGCAASRTCARARTSAPADPPRRAERRGGGIPRDRPRGGVAGPLAPRASPSSARARAPSRAQVRDAVGALLVAVEPARLA